MVYNALTRLYRSPVESHNECSTGNFGFLSEFDRFRASRPFPSLSLSLSHTHSLSQQRDSKDTRERVNRLALAPTAVSPAPMLASLAGGASCGPSNPLQQLSKTYTADRGAQQVRRGRVYCRAWRD